MGNQDGVQGPSLEATLESIIARLGVVERSLSQATMPAMLDLADFGGKVAPTVGQVPAYDVHDRWVPTTLSAGGVQGDAIDLNVNQTVASATTTTVAYTNTPIDTVGTSITVDVSGIVHFNVAGVYLYTVTFLYASEASSYQALSSINCNNGFGLAYGGLGQQEQTDGTAPGHMMTQFAGVTSAHLPVHLNITAKHNFASSMTVNSTLSVVRLA